MFDGPVYDEKYDYDRLKKQFDRIFHLMKDGKWRTFDDIQAITNDPPASISSQLRSFRKKKFGSHTVKKRHKSDRKKGWYEYKLIVNNGNKNSQLF